MHALRCSHQGLRMTRALVGHPGRVGERFLFRVSVLFRLRWLLVALSRCWEQRLLSVAVLGLLTVLVPPWCRGSSQESPLCVGSAGGEGSESFCSFLFLLVAQDRTFPVNGSQNRSVTTWLITVTPFGFRPPIFHNYVSDLRKMQRE